MFRLKRLDNREGVSFVDAYIWMLLANHFTTI